MKYELETIPVWEAYEEHADCPLCFLHERAEQRNTTFFLGNSIMAPEMRVQLNHHGFCPRHFHMLAGGTGKLGLSLALATHLASLGERWAKLEKRLASANGRQAVKAAAEYSAEVSTQEQDCLMCDRIQHNLLNYAYTVATLFQTEDAFRATLAGSSGFCFHHLPLVLRLGAEVLSGATLGEWHRAIIDVQQKSRRELTGHLEAFTWQFDYQTDKKTPPESQDAVPRAVRKLAGFGPGR